MLSAQALAQTFDDSVFFYDILNTTDVQVTGRGVGNTDTDIVIPATASNGTTTYSVTSIGDLAFGDNALTSVAFKGNFGDFQLDVLDINPTLRRSLPVKGQRVSSGPLTMAPRISQRHRQFVELQPLQHPSQPALCGYWASWQDCCL
mgnify:FL=1